MLILKNKYNNVFVCRYSLTTIFYDSAIFPIIFLQRKYLVFPVSRCVPHTLHTLNYWYTKRFITIFNVTKTDLDHFSVLCCRTDHPAAMRVRVIMLYIRHSDENITYFRYYMYNFMYLYKHCPSRYIFCVTPIFVEFLVAK